MHEFEDSQEFKELPEELQTLIKNQMTHVFNPEISRILRAEYGGGMRTAMVGLSIYDCACRNVAAILNKSDRIVGGLWPDKIEDYR